MRSQWIPGPFPPTKGPGDKAWKTPASDFKVKKYCHLSRLTCMAMVESTIQG